MTFRISRRGKQYWKQHGRCFAQLFLAHLFGPGVEPRYGPIRLPKLHVVAVDEPPGGFDGGLIIDTIQLNHANGSVV